MSAAIDTSADVLLNALATDNSPVSAMIEIADRCNEVCVHCYQVQGQKGEMETAEVKRVMADLAALGVMRLTLSGGEPTLRKDFLELVAYARELGFLVVIYTNGLTIDDAMATRLAELSVFAVEISLYGDEAETHDFVTGVPGSFERTVAAIRRLTARGVHVVVKHTVMSLTESRLDAYRAFIVSLGATPMTAAEPMFGREDGTRAPQVFSVSSEAARRERARVVEPVPVEQRLGKPTGPICAAGLSPHVEPNGELRPCTMLQVELGNAKDGALRNLDGNEARAALTALSWDDLHGCRDCDLVGYCGRCYATALEETGDALGPYPTACASARISYEVAHQVTLRPERANSTTGPYRIASGDRLRVVEHVVTREDDELAKRLGWTRPSGFVAQLPPASARPGDLVQLRRPGTKNAKTQRVPGGPRG